MTEQHPITPPPELVKEWIQEADGGHDLRWIEYEQDIANRAAQWGADQELEACCEVLENDLCCFVSNDLRTVRRPKPLSLKEQALEEVGAFEGMGTCNIDIIRRALEAIPDD